ncbi:hypothetical protein BT69DRAFT_1328994 [Atractiella rhizophila]|nr:hypothetical protein BT69DRAFT_1328994 [Atractiella rhizophila]
MPYIATEVVLPFDRSPNVPRIQDLMIAGDGVYVFILDDHEVRLGRNLATEICEEILKKMGTVSPAGNASLDVPS